MNDLVTAIMRQERLDVTFAGGRKGAVEKSFVFTPYSVLLYQTGVYVAGHSSAHGKIISPALDGFQRIEPRKGDHFDYPKDYDPKALFTSGFGLHGAEDWTEPVIKVYPEIAYFIGRAEWHESQSVERDADGGFTLRLRVKGTQELHAWLRSWGPSVEVLGPPELRANVGCSLWSAARRYPEFAAGVTKV